MEADGDPIVFWQEGFSIPSGLANVELKVKYAQTDETVREHHPRQDSWTPTAT